MKTDSTKLKRHWILSNIHNPTQISKILSGPSKWMAAWFSTTEGLKMPMRPGGLASFWHRTDRTVMWFCTAHLRLFPSLRMIAPDGNQGKTDSGLWRQLQFLIDQSCCIRFIPWKLVKWESVNPAEAVRLCHGLPAHRSMSWIPREPGTMPKETTDLKDRDFSRSWNCFWE